VSEKDCDSWVADQMARKAARQADEKKRKEERREDEEARHGARHSDKTTHSTSTHDAEAETLMLPGTPSENQTAGAAAKKLAWCRREYVSEKDCDSWVADQMARKAARQADEKKRKEERREDEEARKAARQADERKRKEERREDEEAREADRVADEDARKAARAADKASRTHATSRANVSSARQDGRHVDGQIAVWNTMRASDTTLPAPTFVGAGIAMVLLALLVARRRGNVSRTSSVTTPLLEEASSIV